MAQPRLQAKEQAGALFTLPIVSGKKAFNLERRMKWMIVVVFHGTSITDHLCR